MRGLTSEFTANYSRRQSVMLAIAASAFVGSLYIFARDQQAISAINGWSADEPFSLWASEPAQRFGDALAQRILPDSNPPLYYSVLYWTRQFIADARSAMTFINLAALTAAVLSVLYFSKKTDSLPLGLIGCATFLLSGPVLRYTAEGRSYLAALALTFVASWLSASAILNPRRPPAWISFALLGALSATIHVYSALMCCCLAAGLFVAAWLWRRSDLWAPSLALGVPAGALTLVWLAYAEATESFGNFAWIPYSVDKVFISAGEVILNAFPVGVNIAALDYAIHTAGAPLRDVILTIFPGMIAFGVIVPFFGLGLSKKRLCIASAAFGVCFLLFFLLPVAASFKQPIIVGRYWLIGAPAVIVLLLFFIQGWLHEVSERAKGWRFSLGAAATAAAVVGLTTFNGFDAARAFVTLKPAWRGGALVSSMSQNCPPRSIHALIPFRDGADSASYGYAFTSKTPEEIFVPVFQGEFLPRVGSEGEIGGSSNSSAPCPVLGWAEHVVREMIHVDMQKASDQELLSLLKIDVAPSDVEILRHRKGYVVLRRNYRADARLD